MLECSSLGTSKKLTCGIYIKNKIIVREDVRKCINPFHTVKLLYCFFSFFTIQYKLKATKLQSLF